MKRTQCMVIVTLLFLGVSGAAAQSLGDYAREARKNKPDQGSTSRHYDNDNLPTGDTLSVVGPPPSNDANADNAKAAAARPAPSAADRKKTTDEWQKKLEDQKQKIESLNHDLDLAQRELRLRVAAEAVDPGVTARDFKWDKEDGRYKTEIEEKQKTLGAARQQLSDLQEQAHKAGFVESEKDSDNEKGKDKEVDKDKDKDKNN